MALGDGIKMAGKVIPFQVKEGDTVLYSKFGFTFTELSVKGEDFILAQEPELIGTLPVEEPTADDIVDLSPIGDRIFVKVTETASVTSGGVMVPDSAKDKPLSGVVVRTGSGKLGQDGEVAPPKVKEGDKVLYFKYAGENMETTDGT